MAVFPKGKYDYQVDSTAQFLDWFKKPFPGQGIFEYYRQEFEKLQRQPETEETWVRLRAPPPGIGAVQTGPNRHYNVRPDGTFEMPADDAAFLIPQGWTKIAEWTRQHAVWWPTTLRSSAKSRELFDSYNVRDVSERTPPAMGPHACLY